MKAVLGALINTSLLVSILAPVGVAVMWLLLTGLHASPKVMISGELLMIIPTLILATMLFKLALQAERGLRDSA
jgi:ABC-type multidrug transport system permease subunit